MNPHIRAPARPPRGAAARWLAGLCDPLTARVRVPELEALAQGLDPGDPATALTRVLDRVRADLGARAQVHARAEGLRRATLDRSPSQVRQALERHLRMTVPRRRDRAADLRALDRWLDLDALLERDAARAESLGARIEVALGLTPGLVRAACPQGPAAEAAARALIEATGLDTTLLDRVAEEPRAVTRRAALKALAALAPWLGPDGRSALGRVASDPGEDPWARRAAVGGLQEGSLVGLLHPTDAPDDALVRARAVEVMLQCNMTSIERLLCARQDPSELVRFTLAEGLCRRLKAGDPQAEAALRALLTPPSPPRTRAWTADQLQHAGATGWGLLCLALGDPDAFVLQCSIDAARALLRREGGPPPADLGPALQRLAHDPRPFIARAALALRAEVEAAAQPAWPLARSLAELRPGQRLRVRLPASVTALDLARALVPFAQDDFGFSLQPRGGPERPGASVRVSRGERLGPTLRRTLHELRHPRPDKRQGHSHATAPVDQGALRVPPAGLAEDNPTGVPGQRVRDDGERSWVPALPRVDDAVHALGRREVVLVTAEGLTRLRRPQGLAWLRAWGALQWRYGALDAARARSLAASDEAGATEWARRLRGLGFTLEGPAEGPSARLFRLALDPLAYLLSMGANGLQHLAVVVALLAALLFGRAALARAQVRRARRQIPLVIGGWGTRGKSGTERLKAAVLEGLGVPTLSKTTGCEAMVLRAPPGGRALELFLFRPYDKATIWEQAAVVRLAAATGARAFLWECMALNPLYVAILQQRWMRDDLATLTNAYPDHEDVMGPTGLDVAETIGGFAPPGAVVLTTEGSMRPALREQARQRGCALLGLSRAATTLVPADLMARMPHAEHPANVALAAAVAEQLGVDRTEAIGLMADHVLPDLGALVIAPEVAHMGRRVVFVNGMSANDEVSFRHNWRRAGFATPPAGPADWRVTVVNNRADRIPRSRAFARILVRHAPAHRHVLIGTNLEGLARYIEEATAELLAELPFDRPEDRRAAFARLPVVDPTRLPQGSDAALQHEASRWSLWCRAEALAPAEARAAWASLMRSALVFVQDPGASGDQVIAAAVGAAPAGCSVRLLGAQNIKGTGLDFAYQWVWWREVHALLDDLDGAAPARCAAALDSLEAIPFDAVMTLDAVLPRLDALLDAPALPVAPPLRARVAALRQRLTRRRAALMEARERPRDAARAAPARQLLERLLDPFDAVLRHRRARQLLNALAEQRISHRRAQRALKELTARQKGGWLAP
ncbi:MAG: hypothetical protein H6739_12890 [Alphaproteobacteria bacterium]|nr:hypothetical protein [Alphaproteobacteria bacterium]